MGTPRGQYRDGDDLTTTDGADEVEVHARWVARMGAWDTRRGEREGERERGQAWALSLLVAVAASFLTYAFRLEWSRDDFPPEIPLLFFFSFFF
jgi:hypothetical protein